MCDAETGVDLGSEGAQMAEWQVARLIPTWGINSDAEAEMRAASATLAVISIVREFSSALLTPLGASSARKALVESFVEVSFKLPDGTVVRPDGLIRVTFGKNIFTALVEVKTAQNLLQADQVNAYWEVARQYGFNAVITISNEIAAGNQHPTAGLKVRANSKVQVHHFSWSRLLATAVMCKTHQGIADTEQAWILGELIRYLESGASGAVAFSDMGPNWVAVRDGAKESTLRKNSDEVRDIAQRWDQLLQFAAMRLGSEIGADVQQVIAKAQQDPKVRHAHVVDTLCGSGVMAGVLKVPNAVGPIGLEADLRARRVMAWVDVGAPNDRGNKARATWLLRQIGEDVPNGLCVEVWPRQARTPIVASWVEATEDRSRLDDPDGRDVLRYRLLLRAEMGGARKTGGKAGGFVDSVVGLLDRFYGGVVQGLSPWVPTAPRLRAKDEAPSAVPAEIVDSIPDAEEAMDLATEAVLASVRDRTSGDRGAEEAESDDANRSG